MSRDFTVRFVRGKIILRYVDNATITQDGKVPAQVFFCTKYQTHLSSAAAAAAAAAGMQFSAAGNSEQSWRGDRQLWAPRELQRKDSALATSETPIRGLIAGP